MEEETGKELWMSEDGKEQARHVGGVKEEEERDAGAVVVVVVVVAVVAKLFVR